MVGYLQSMESNMVSAINWSIAFKKHTKSLLQRNNMDFEEFERYFDILNQNHDAITWLKQITRNSYF